MSKSSVPKADGIKQLRGVKSPGDAGDVKPGDWPIRRKGYYRALRAGKKWAVELSNLPALERCLKWIYARAIEHNLNCENPFLKLVKKETNGGFTGKYLPIPTGDKDED